LVAYFDDHLRVPVRRKAAILHAVNACALELAKRLCTLLVLLLKPVNDVFGR
jgi:hypothetical protein